MKCRGAGTYGNCGRKESETIAETIELGPLCKSGWSEFSRIYDQIWMKSRWNQKKIKIKWHEWECNTYDNSKTNLHDVSYWRLQSKLALTGRRIDDSSKLWCPVASGGSYILVSSTSFQKNDISWPQQPPTKRVSNISEILDFWWSIPQKGASIGHSRARDDPTIRISKMFDGMRLLRSLRLLRLLRLLRSLRLPMF